MVKSNDLQFVAKFAIAGPDGEVPESAPVEEPEETQEDFSEARDIDAMRRRVGTVQEGVSVDLTWEGPGDLGLSVVNSEGEEVSFFSPEGLSGGAFDVEGFEPKSGNRSIRWNTSPPSGEYSVVVKHYQSSEDDGDIQFKVNINNKGEEEEHSGSIPSDESSIEAARFQI